MTEPQFYVEPGADDNPTIRERAIPGTRSTVDHVVAHLQSGFGLHIELAYEDLAFAVLARVLAPDEATVERLARAIGENDYHGWDDLPLEAQQNCIAAATRVLAVLAEVGDGDE